MKSAQSSLVSTCLPESGIGMQATSIPLSLFLYS
jgi:hypothetical protein